MKIVFTDSKIIDRGDIDWTPVSRSGEFQNISDMDRETAIEVLSDAEAVMVDAFRMDREMIEAAPKLKFIGAAATGYDNVDVAFAKERGIAVCNVPAYSTEAVAQHAIALLLALADRIPGYDSQVKEGRWTNESGEAYEPLPLLLLEGKSLGIVGYGNIGRKVAEIARVLGMRVNVYESSRSNDGEGDVDRDNRAVMGSDVISLHCPLTDENAGLVDREFIDGMKDGAILINTARGGLVDSNALAEALGSGKLAGYGTDVMSPEPPDADDPLLKAPNCIITPHIAFTPREIRQRVVDICGENLKAYLDGREINRIV